MINIWLYRVYGQHAWEEGRTSPTLLIANLYYGTCHNCTVKSLLAEAMRVPSGDQATAFTRLEWPL